jgi:superfamily II DNA or RNA helicase/HKD family nuclease/diadenosine tetraphosphate (Ap4A) HIT family hydrolase
LAQDSSFEGANLVDIVCPFCNLRPERIFYRDPLVIGLWDGFPVTPGHALLIPVRHVPTWFEATMEERNALMRATDAARVAIEASGEVDGYNIGLNSGSAAGQTVFHLHVHVIPRRVGDMPDPRGGVRHVIPERGNYVRDSAEESTPPYVDRSLAKTLWTGGQTDPLLPDLKAHLSRAKGADIVVAFALRSGVEELFPFLQDLLNRDGAIRLLTGDYLDATDPDALQRLLDLEGNFDCRVFETKLAGLEGSRSFHPKAYLIREVTGSCAAFIGSSNLSRVALTHGVEWNYRVVRSKDHAEWRQIQAAFDKAFASPSVVELTPEWIDGYRKRRNATPVAVPAEIEPDTPMPVPMPHPIQAEALEALQATRLAGNTAGLVVLATGLGKTWLSAFDSVNFRKVLFVAHREEILAQALSNFRSIRPHDLLGRFSGTEKTESANVLFASIQTLSRRAHLDKFEPEEFEYIVVDEFHHAEAATYRRLIQHFKPKFLLGLTATPERSDGGDLLSLCGNNLVFRCDLTTGVRRGLLCTFHYFGVPDIVDYRNIPWRSSRFDEQALTQAVATEARSKNALDQYRQRAGSRTIAFCVSQRHSDYMSDFFNRNGVLSRSVHSGESSSPRAESLEMLKTGRVSVICAVDMFNEGVDVPELDTVMMLRPTESKIIFLQQLGRGLRRAENKPYLTIIDYIGNHRAFLLKPQALFGLPSGDREMLRLLDQWDAMISDLPPGCEVTYELEVKDMLRQLLRVGGSAPDLLKQRYLDFRKTLGVRPNAAELRREGYDPRALHSEFGSWFRFVQAQGDLSNSESTASSELSAFLDDLESTPMTKSYKMLVIQALLNRGCLPGSLSLTELASEVQDMAKRDPRIERDIGEAIGSQAELERLLTDNPVKAWVNAKGTKGGPHFTFASGRLKSTFSVDQAVVPAAQELVRELVDWRLADYFTRQGAISGASYILKVSHTAGKPILFLPERQANPDLPVGWTTVRIGGESVHANFVQIAINVVRREGSEDNVLPQLLAHLFGPDAGKPGTRHQMVLQNVEGTWELRPAGGGGLQATPYKTYKRSEIAPLFGFSYVENLWRQGFVPLASNYILLVTLDKSQHADSFKYADRFLSADEFVWQSQNRMKRESISGKALAQHKSRGFSVHLYVREKAKTKQGETSPFYYCGLLEFLSWEGDNPITVSWRLLSPVPGALWDSLGVPRTSL